MHPANFEQVDSFITPKSIVLNDIFYLFYTVKSIPSKVGGILAMGFSIIVFIILPINR